MTERRRAKLTLENKVCSSLIGSFLVFLVGWMAVDCATHVEPPPPTDLWTMSDYSSICMTGEFLGINTENPNTIEVWCAECYHVSEDYCTGDLVAYSQNIFETEIERHVYAEARYVPLDTAIRRDAWFPDVATEVQFASEHCPSGELFGFLGTPEGREYYCRYGPQIIDMTTGAILAHDFKNFTETTFLLPLDG